MAQEPAGRGGLPGPGPEVLLQRRQRAVVTERDRPEGPGHDGEMDGQEAAPPPRRPPAEDQHRQIGEVEATTTSARARYTPDTSPTVPPGSGARSLIQPAHSLAPTS